MSLGVFSPELKMTITDSNDVEQKNISNLGQNYESGTLLSHHSKAGQILMEI